VEADDGFRAFEPAGERRAVFCRLEHVIPWAIQDAHWEAGAVDEPAGVAQGVERCSHCDAELTDTLVLLVRHRGEHRVADGFCSVDHLEAWAKAGGRWQA
jgi:PP-loop superfamily ATP-utilizing enzyme